MAKEYTMSELCEISGFTWSTMRRMLDLMKKVPIVYTGSKIYFEMSDEDLEVIKTTSRSEDGRQEYREKRRLSLQQHMKARAPRDLLDKQNTWLISWGITRPVVSSKESYSNLGFMNQK